jgi:hypothetical protein
MNMLQSSLKPSHTRVVVFVAADQTAFRQETIDAIHHRANAIKVPLKTVFYDLPVDRLNLVGIKVSTCALVVGWDFTQK